MTDNFVLVHRFYSSIDAENYQFALKELGIKTDVKHDNLGGFQNVGGEYLVFVVESDREKAVEILKDFT